MSKPVSKTLIGIFILGAIALLVIAVAVLGSGKFFRGKFEAVCFFDGSVSGLNEGAPVVFRGVKIGSVKDIALRYNVKNFEFMIPVYIELDPKRLEALGPAPVKIGENLEALIGKGLRAQLEMQSILTGQLHVALDLLPDKPAKFVGADPRYPEIPTVSTPLQELARKIEKIPIERIFEKLLHAVEGVEGVVNSPELKEAIRSISVALEDVRKLAKNVEGEVGPLASNLNETVQDIRKLVQNADSKVSELASNLDGVVRKVDNRIDPLADSIDGTIKSTEATLNMAQKAIERIEGTVGEESSLVYELNKTLEEVSALARSIRVLSDYLQRHPESVLRGK
jgi:paraquat-inducible protein B